MEQTQVFKYLITKVENIALEIQVGFEYQDDVDLEESTEINQQEFKMTLQFNNGSTILEYNVMSQYMRIVYKLYEKQLRELCQIEQEEEKNEQEQNCKVTGIIYKLPSEKTFRLINNQKFKYSNKFILKINEQNQTTLQYLPLPFGSIRSQIQEFSSSINLDDKNEIIQNYSSFFYYQNLQKNSENLNFGFKKNNKFRVKFKTTYIQDNSYIPNSSTVYPLLDQEESQRFIKGEDSDQNQELEYQFNKQYIKGKVQSFKEYQVLLISIFVMNYDEKSRIYNQPDKFLYNYIDNYFFLSIRQFYYIKEKLGEPVLSARTAKQVHNFFQNYEFAPEYRSPAIDFTQFDIMGCQSQYSLKESNSHQNCLVNIAQYKQGSVLLDNDYELLPFDGKYFINNSICTYYNNFAVLIQLVIFFPILKDFIPIPIDILSSSPLLKHSQFLIKENENFQNLVDREYIFYLEKRNLINDQLVFEFSSNFSNFSIFIKQCYNIDLDEFDSEGCQKPTDQNYDFKLDLHNEQKEGYNVYYVNIQRVKQNIQLQNIYYYMGNIVVNDINIDRQSEQNKINFKYYSKHSNIQKNNKLVSLAFMGIVVGCLFIGIAIISVVEYTIRKKKQKKVFYYIKSENA